MNPCRRGNFDDFLTSNLLAYFHAKPSQPQNFHHYRDSPRNCTSSNESATRLRTAVPFDVDPIRALSSSSILTDAIGNLKGTRNLRSGNLIIGAQVPRNARAGLPPSAIPQEPDRKNPTSKLMTLAEFARKKTPSLFLSGSRHVVFLCLARREPHPPHPGVFK